MQTHPAVEQNKTLYGPTVHRISPVGKEEVYRGKDLQKNLSLFSHSFYCYILKQIAGIHWDVKGCIFVTTLKCSVVICSLTSVCVCF